MYARVTVYLIKSSANRWFGWFPVRCYYEECGHVGYPTYLISRDCGAQSLADINAYYKAATVLGASFSMLGKIQSPCSPEAYSPTVGD